MGRRAKKSKDEILDLVAPIFQKHGYSGSTLSLLVDAAGLDRASLYHHFPGGKDEIALAVLGHVIHNLQTSALCYLDEIQNPENSLLNMLEGLKSFYDEGSSLCLVTVFSIGDISSEIRSFLLAALESWSERLFQCLKALDTAHTRQDADGFLARLQGSLVLSVCSGNKAYFLSALADYERSWLGPLLASRAPPPK